MKFAIIYNDGNLNYKDFGSECRDEGWLPVAILRDKTSTDIHVPIFTNSNTAHNFMKRNFKTKEVQSGILLLCDEDIANMEDRGWKMMPLKFPRRFAEGHPEYELDVEVLELDESPDLKSYSSPNVL